MTNDNDAGDIIERDGQPVSRGCLELAATALALIIALAVLL